MTHMLRLAIILSALALLAGCISFGPRDGQLFVVGSTPADDSCVLSVVAAGHDPTVAVHSRSVSGQFRESFVIGPSRHGHVATLSCNASVVATRQFKYGRDVHIAGELIL